MSPALAVSGVTKTYADEAVVDAVTFEVAPGTVHALLGPNGAGKTTLLRMVLGLVTPSAGSVAAVGPVAGFVEAPAFWPYLSAPKTLQLLGSLEGLAVDVEALLAQAGLDGGRKPVGDFSVGMRQRLGIAAALLRSPRLLVLDEPTTGLDVSGRAALRELLAGLAADGVAVLLSSHVMAEVDETCTHATVLARGRVVADGTLESLRARAPEPQVLVGTSDDAHAARLLRSAAVTEGGVLVRGSEAQLDAAVLALAAEGVAVRSMARVESPLQELFLELTA